MKIVVVCCVVLLWTGGECVPQGVRLFPTILQSDWAYQGHLREGERVVRLSPSLRAVPIKNTSQSMRICGFYIHHDSDELVPFVVLVIDDRIGTGQIRLKSGLKVADLSDRYTFQIEAYDCDNVPHFSERRFVLVEVGTVNTPKFLKNSYQFSVNSSIHEGSKIGEVVAIERPVSDKQPSTGQGICKYEIISSKTVPFIINQYGSLFIQRIEINAGVSIKYRFYVRATDCNVKQPRMSSVPVSVDIFNDCDSYWTGLPEKVQYKRGSGVLSLISHLPQHPNLHLCMHSCSNLQIELTTKLHGESLAPASSDKCRHDSESLRRQEILCDTSTDAINLLKDAPKSMIDYKFGGYYFSNSHVPVETHLDNTNHVLQSTFTIMFWMKHDLMKLNDPKQHILCNSDREIKNRHHYSLFLHNCKILLLIRKENWEASKDQFKPSEWRFGPLKEVCDNKWHHYSVIMNHGNPMLQIDGEIWTGIPDVLIEKPLQKLPGNSKGTKFTVGGCYHSKTRGYVQDFIGHLAGVKLLKSKSEAVNNIRCLATCGEAILLPHIVEVINADSSVTLFSENATLRSDNVNDFMIMFSKLSYVNTNPENKPQTRGMSIKTNIKCGSSTFQLPTHSINISILESSFEEDIAPSIYISSESMVEGYIKKPIELFPNMRFIKANDKNDRLKSCIIRPVGRVIQSWEYLNWPINMAINYHFTSLNNSHGLIIEAKQTLDVYQKIIRTITFITQKSSNSYREFGLICNIEGKIVTNEIIVKVSVKDEDLRTYFVQEVQEGDTSEDQSGLPAGGDKPGFKDELLKNKADPKLISKSNNIVWIVVGSVFILVICSAFIALYVFRRFHRNSRSNNNVTFKSFKMKNMGKPKVIKDCQPMDTKSLSDSNSIISDAPESSDEIDPDELEERNIDCEDEIPSENDHCNRIHIHQPMNQKNKSLLRLYGPPVDV